MTADELLNGPDYFTCERRHCRMPVATCIKRQKTGVYALGGHHTYIPLECRDCDQGKDNLDGKKHPIAGSFQEEKKPQQIKELKTAKGGGNAPLERKEMAMKRKCANCQREKAVVKDGMCFTCNKAGKGKTGEERDKALVDVRTRIKNGGLRHTGGGGKSKRTPPAGLPPSEAVAAALSVIPEKTGTQEQTVIPVTLRLTVEIAVRVTGIGA